MFSRFGRGRIRMPSRPVRISRVVSAWKSKGNSSSMAVSASMPGVGGCGCYHPNFGFRDTYVLSTINNQDCKTSGNLSEAPQLQLSKMKTSNLIEGRFGCRAWRSQLNILERTFAFNFDLYTNMSCHESPELSQLMERMGGKPYYFLFSENNNKLTLSDKNDTFVFIKTK